MKLNKKQKRTATIASMAALLAVVLGMGGQTFAKYITTATVETNQATVAKWGVVINTSAAKGTNSKTMFSKNYEDGDVSAELESVAPGTEGSLSITISGAPEVKTNIAFDVNNDYKRVYFDTYEPIVWKINDDICGEKGTMSEMVYDFKNLTKTYSVGESFANTYKISWSWVFSSGDANDILDTKLADAATLTEEKWEEKYKTELPGYSAEVSAVFTVTATQVGD